MAFSRLISEWFHEFHAGVVRAGERTLKVISIGDSLHEREAIFKVHQQSSSMNFVPKSIKFAERPTIAELVNQHKVLHAKFGVILSSAGKSDLCIRSGDIEPFHFFPPSAPLIASSSVRRPLSVELPTNRSSRRTRSGSVNC